MPDETRLSDEYVQAVLDEARNTFLYDLTTSPDRACSYVKVRLCSDLLQARKEIAELKAEAESERVNRDYECRECGEAQDQFCG